jgi:hypothetical protein
VLIIEHPARADWQLVSGSKEPDEKGRAFIDFAWKFHRKAQTRCQWGAPRLVHHLSTHWSGRKPDCGLCAGRCDHSRHAQSVRSRTAQKAAVAKLEEEM